MKRKNLVFIIMVIISIIILAGVNVEKKSDLSADAIGIINSSSCQEDVVKPLQNWTWLSEQKKRRVVSRLWAYAFSSDLDRFTITTEIPASRIYSTQKGYIEFSDEYIQTMEPSHVLKELVYVCREFSINKRATPLNRIINRRYAQKYVQFLFSSYNSGECISLYTIKTSREETSI